MKFNLSDFSEIITIRPMKTKQSIIGLLAAALIIGAALFILNFNTTQTLNNMITLQTNYGDIKIELYADKAPKTVENFTGLATAGKYDGVIFHRVIENFMIQGGDYENGNGTGGQSLWGGMFEDEFHPELTHVRGALSMANRGPNTNGSQFFIMHADAPHLNGLHSVFGQVVEGLDVLDKIATTETGFGDRPTEDIMIESIIQ